MQKSPFFSKDRKSLLIVTAVCALVLQTGAGTLVQAEAAPQVYKQPVAKLYVGEVKALPAAEEPDPTPLPPPEESPMKPAEQEKPPMESAAPEELDAEAQALLPVADPDFIAEPEPAPDFDKQNGPALLSPLDAVEKRSDENEKKALPGTEEQKPRPNNNAELVYDLPENIFSQSEHIRQTEDPQTIAQSPSESRAGDPVEQESYEHASMPGAEKEQEQAAAQGAPPRALALYGSSAGRKAEGPSLFSPNGNSPSAGLKSVTSINRALFAPLGMYQLAVGSPDKELTMAPGESRFSQDFDLMGMSLRPSLGVYWYSEHYTDYHFGPNSRQIALGGMRERETLQDISPFFGLTLDVALRGNWSAFINGEISLPGSRIRDDAAMGSHNESVTTGLIYTFQ